MTKFHGHQLTRRRFLRISAVAGVSLALSGGLLKTLLEASTVQRASETRTQMGTLITISVIHPDGDTARRMVTGAFDEMERLESILSRHRSGTAISLLNERGVVHNAPVEAVQVVRQALEYSAITSGAFDITMNPILGLYVSNFERTNQPPADSELLAAVSRVGFENLVVDDTSIRFKKAGMSLTLDGIAKGYIADQAVGVLERMGADRVLVDAGGDFSVLGGGADGDGWKIAVADPSLSDRYLATLKLRDQSVATSGDYLQSFTDDRRFHHIIDPRTGNSPDHTSAVTVIAPTAMAADALSTAVFVLGPSEGIDLLERLDVVEGVVVDKQQQVFKTNGFDRYTV